MKWLYLELFSFYYHGQNIWDKLFSCEIAYYGKSSISIFQQFFASISKIFILGVGLGTKLYFNEVLRFSWYFLIPQNPKS